MLVFLTILLSFFTLTNHRTRGTWVVPLTITLIFLGGSIWTGLQLPKTIKNIEERQKLKKVTSQLTAKQRSNMQQQFQATTPNDNELVLNSAQREASLVLQEQAYAKQLGKAYAQIGTVSFDRNKKAFQLKLYANSTLAKGVGQVEQQPSLAEQSSWPTFTQTIVKTSEVIKDRFQPGYTLELMGVNHPSDVLFAVKDGETISDIAAK
jgi:hypothetical protein